MAFSPAVPIFRIFDRSKAAGFYLQYLGFAVDWTHNSPGEGPSYQQISRDGLVLHLSEHHGDCSPGARIRVQVNGLKLYHEQLASKNYAFMKPGLTQTPWGDTEMSVIDPFGNTITFHEAIQTSEDGKHAE